MLLSRTLFREYRGEFCTIFLGVFLKLVSWELAGKKQ